MACCRIPACFVFATLNVLLAQLVAAFREDIDTKTLPKTWPQTPIVKPPSGDCPCAQCREPDWINLEDIYDEDSYWTTRKVCHFTKKYPLMQWWCHVNDTCTCADKWPGMVFTYRWAPCGQGSVQMKHFMQVFPRLKGAARKELCAQWDSLLHSEPFVFTDPISEDMVSLCNGLQYEQAKLTQSKLFPYLQWEVQTEKTLVTLIQAQLQSKLDVVGRPVFVDAMDICYQSMENRGRNVFATLDPCHDMKKDASIWVRLNMASKLGNSDAAAELGQLCQIRSANLNALRSTLRHYRRSIQAARPASAKKELISKDRQKMDDRWGQIEKKLQLEGKIKDVAELAPSHPTIATLEPLTDDRLQQLALLMRTATSGVCSGNPKSWSLRCCEAALKVDEDMYSDIVQKLRR